LNKIIAPVVAFFTSFIFAQATRGEEAQRFNVRDYKAVADGSTDDAAAIQAAVNAAIKSKQPAEVFLPKGVYRLGHKIVGPNPHTYAQSFINIIHGREIVIRGEQGTELLSSDLAHDFFSLVDCKNVTVRDLAMDCDPLPYTQGRIECVDVANKTVVLRIDQGYDELDRDDFKEFYDLRIYDHPFYEGSMLDVYPHIKSRQRLGPGLWKCELKYGPDFQLRPSHVGKKWINWGVHFHGWAFRVSLSSDCLFENVKFYAGGDGMFSFWGNPGDLTARHCYVGPPPDSGRLFTTDGGTMMFYNRGTVRMIGCDFSHTDDDCFNMGTQYSRIGEAPDDYTFGFKHWDSPLPPQIGDVIEVYDWQSGRRKGAGKLVDIEPRQGGGFTCKIDRPVSFNLGTAQTAPPGQETGADRIIDINSAGRAIIQNNRFSSLRARCVLIKSPNSVVEGNTFYNTHMPGVVGGEKLSGIEGPSSRNLVVRNNIFKNVDAANIYFSGYENVNATIEGNTFTNYGRFPIFYDHTQGVAIDLKNMSGAHVANNIFEPSPGRPQGVPQILLDNSEHIEIGANQGLVDVGRR